MRHMGVGLISQIPPIGSLIEIDLPIGQEGSGLMLEQDQETGLARAYRTRPINEVEASLFKALAHPARVGVLEALRDGEKSVSELLPMLGLAPPHLSQQLSILKLAGLIDGRRCGTRILYTLAFPELLQVLDAARQVLAFAYAKSTGVHLVLDEWDTTSYQEN